MKAVAKDAVNPHFKNRYQTLDAILAMARPILNRNGIALVQYADGETLKTVVIHASGETLEIGPMPLKLDKNNSQGMGSAITYARRYSVSALLGISTEEDDDGNAASATVNQPPVKEAKSVEFDVLDILTALLDQTKTDRKKFLDYYKASSLEVLTNDEAKKAISMLEAKLAKMGKA